MLLKAVAASGALLLGMQSGIVRRASQRCSHVSNSHDTDPGQSTAFVRLLSLDTMAMRQAPHNIDPRPYRTREALRSAFILLALRRRYHEIRIADILEASGIGPSTFYEHFASKDASLAASMNGATSLLADMCAGKAST